MTSREAASPVAHNDGVISATLVSERRGMTRSRHGDNEILMQIGDVAELIGLSLRTIRYYEESGLVTPSARTAGGFRLYTNEDVERLRLVMRMKPLGLTLDEMCDLLKVLDGPADHADEADPDAHRERLEHFTEMVGERCERLREQLAAGIELVDLLRARSTHRSNQVDPI